MRSLRLVEIGLGLGLGLGGCAGTRIATPQPVRAQIEKSPRGVDTVVLFTDFQCPHCRRSHAALAPLLAERAGHVRVVVKHVPLRIHKHATDAARASVCGETLAKEPAALDHALYMADRLEIEDLVDLATKQGVDRAAFEACLSSKDTDERIVRDIQDFEAVQGEGVPLVFVNEHRFEGTAETDEYRAAFSR